MAEELLAVDETLRRFRALSEALDERLRKRDQEGKWEPDSSRTFPEEARQEDEPAAASTTAGAGLPPAAHGQAAAGGAPSINSSSSDIALQHSEPLSQISSGHRPSQGLNTHPTVRFRNTGASTPESSPLSAYNPHAPAPAPARSALSFVGTRPPVELHSDVQGRGSSPGAAAADTPAMGGRTGPTVSTPPQAAAVIRISASELERLPLPAAPADPISTILAATAGTGHWEPLVLPGTQRSIAAAAAGTAVAGGQVQYRALLSAAQAAKRDAGARARQFHDEMAEIDGEIDQYVGSYKFEQYAPDAALTVQTAWRARRVRVFFAAFMTVRRKHLRRQMRVAFSPLKQLVLSVLHARRRMLRRAFEEWRDWVRLSNELFLKLMSMLRGSIGSVTEHATPQQLWHLCIAPGGHGWTAKLTLGTLVSNVLLRQMPQRTAALYLAAWRNAVANQVAKRQAAGEVMRRMEDKRFQEYVRLLFRFWFRWSVNQVSERLNIPPPIFRPRLPEWDTWLFKHTRSRELHSRIILLHKGFRVRHFFAFWLFFTRRNKRMRQAWISTAAQHVEAILRSSMNAFKANAAEARKLRRTKRTIFNAIMHMTQRNKTVRRIAKEVHEISRLAQMRQAFRRLREWGRANQLLCTAGAIQIMARRATASIPAYALLDDPLHMWFHLCWRSWRNYTLGRLRMRCLLGLHLSRGSTVPLELAFKALRKWAIMQRMARAQAALAAVQQHLAGLQGIVAGADAGQGDGGGAGSSRRQTSVDGGAGEGGGRVSMAGGRTSVSGSVSTSGAANGTGVHSSTFEMFVSLADFPPPAGGSWRTLYDKGDVMMGLAAHACRLARCDGNEKPVDPWAVVNLTDDDKQHMMNDAVRDLEELSGAFQLRPGERHMLLNPCRRREVTNTHRQWVDVEHPVSTIWQVQTQPDPRIWQRLVGLVSCMAPHPDHPAGHLLDQTRLPMADQAYRVRRTVYRARMAPDVGEAEIHPPAPLAEASDGAASLSAGMGGSPGAGSVAGSSPRSMGAGTGGSGGGGGDAEAAAPAPVGGGSGGGALVPLAPQATRARGIVLLPQEEDVLLLHRLCEAEDFLDSVMHVALEVSGHETVFMRRALAARVARGTLYGDALAAIMQPALRLDLLTAAADLRHRHNRDRVITLGVDLAEKAHAYSEHRPEFTLAQSRKRALPAPVHPLLHVQAAAAPAARAGVTLEHGVGPAAAAAPGVVAGALAGGHAGAPALEQQPSEAVVTEGEEEEDQDAVRAKRKQQALLDAEAAVVAMAQGAAADGQDGLGSMADLAALKKWKSVRAVSMSKSALIRMEMISGKSLRHRDSTSPGASSPATPSRGGRSAGGRSQSYAPVSWANGLRGSGPTAQRSSQSAAEPPASRHGRGRSTTEPPASLRAGGRSIVFGADGRSPGSTATGDAPEPPPRSLAASMSRAMSKRHSFKSMASSAWGRDTHGAASPRGASAATTAGGLEGWEGDAGELSDPDALALHKPPERKEPEGPPPLLNTFIYLTPPSFLSAGRVMDPTSFPWPKEVPVPELIQGKAQFVLRSILPSLAAMPQLPDIIFGPLGDPRTHGATPTGPSPEPSGMSHASMASLKHEQLLAAALAAANENDQEQEEAEAEASAMTAGSGTGAPPAEASTASLDHPPAPELLAVAAAAAGQLSKQASLLSLRTSVFGPGSLTAADRAAQAAAAHARKEMRTRAMLSELLGQDPLEAEGGFGAPPLVEEDNEGPDREEEGVEEEAAAAKRAALALGSMRGGGSFAAGLLGLTFKGAAGDDASSEGGVTARSQLDDGGLQAAFGTFGVHRGSAEGGVGLDVEASLAMDVTPRNHGNAGGAAGSGAMGGDGKVAAASNAPAGSKGSSSVPKASPRGTSSHQQFHVTPQQLNIFMGGHLRRGAASVNSSMSMRRPSEQQPEEAPKGLIRTADGLYVTPNGVEVVRELIIPDDDDFDDGDTDGRRTTDLGNLARRATELTGTGRMTITNGGRRVTVTRKVIEMLPFEEQYNFMKTVWLPPDRRVNMLDDYDLGQALRSGTAGELHPPLQQWASSASSLQGQVAEYLAAPGDTAFMREFEEELQRTKVGRARSGKGNVSRWRSRSEMPRAGSAAGSAAAVLAAANRAELGSRGSAGSGLSMSAAAGPSRKSVASAKRVKSAVASRFGRGRYSLVSDAAFMTEEEEEAAAGNAAARRSGTAPSSPHVRMPPSLNSPGGAPWLEDIPVEESGMSVNLIASSAAAAAAMAVGEDPAVLRLLALDASASRSAAGGASGGSTARAGALNSSASLSPWESPSQDDGVEAGTGSGAGSHLFPSGAPAGGVPAAGGGAGLADGSRSTASATAMKELLAMRVGRAASAAGPSPLGQQATAGSAAGSASAAAGAGYDPASIVAGHRAALAAIIGEDGMAGMVSPEAAAAMEQMFGTRGALQPQKVRPRSRIRKRGNLRTGDQELLDPLVAGALVEAEPPPPQQQQQQVQQVQQAEQQQRQQEQAEAAVAVQQAQGQEGLPPPGSCASVELVGEVSSVQGTVGGRCTPDFAEPHEPQPTASASLESLASPGASAAGSPQRAGAGGDGDGQEQEQEPGAHGESEPAEGPGSPTALRPEATLTRFSASGVPAGVGADGEGAQAEAGQHDAPQQREEEEEGEHVTLRPPPMDDAQLVLLRDEGVRQQLEALREMWTSDPYSARPWLDPVPPGPNQRTFDTVASVPFATARRSQAGTAALAATAAAEAASAATAAAAATVAGAGQQAGGGGVPLADKPVRIGAGLARALAEAEAEQWALYDKAVEKMARDFARAMQQLPPEEQQPGGEGGAGGAGAAGGAGGAGDKGGEEGGEDWEWLGDVADGGDVGAGDQNGGVADGLGPWEAAGTLGAGAAPDDPPPRSGPGSPGLRAPGSRGGVGSRAGAGASAGRASSSRQRNPLTGRATRGLLDALEEALAASLDPTVLTGLSLERYTERTSDLVQRLLVAPAASKFMFWRKVQTVQQLRQKMMEDRAMAEQLRSIAWAGAFNPYTMAPPGTDPAPGKSGPFSGEQLAHAASRRREQQQQQQLHRQRLSQHFGMIPGEGTAPTLGEGAVGEAGGAGGSLVGHRAAWAPMGPPDDPGAALAPPPMAQSIHMVRQARLQPKPQVAATASSRDVLPKRVRRPAGPDGAPHGPARRIIPGLTASQTEEYLHALLSHPNATNRLSDGYGGSSSESEEGGGKRKAKGKKAGKKRGSEEEGGEGAAGKEGAEGRELKGGGSGAKRGSVKKQGSKDPFAEWEVDGWDPGTEVPERKERKPKKAASQRSQPLSATKPGELPGAQQHAEPSSRRLTSEPSAQTEASQLTAWSGSVAGEAAAGGGAAAAAPKDPPAQPHYLATTASAVARQVSTKPHAAAESGGSGATGGWFLTEAEVASGAESDGTAGGGAASGAASDTHTHDQRPPASVSEHASSAAEPDASSTPLAPGEGLGYPPGSDGDTPPRRARRQKLQPATLQVALARRAELRAALAARGELLELDEMDLEELEEEADLVDQLVEASIRVYGKVLAARHAARGADGAVVVAGEGVVLPGRGRALGWAAPGPHDLGRGDAILLSPNDPWVRPVGLNAGSPAHGSPQRAPLPAVAGTGAMAASKLSGLRGPQPSQRPSAAAAAAATGATAPLGQEEVDPHLPSPTRQGKPLPAPPAPLAPAAVPRPVHAGPLHGQEGSVRFPAPLESFNPLRASAPAGLLPPGFGPPTARMGAPPSAGAPVIGPAGLQPLVGGSRLGTPAAGPAALKPNLLPLLRNSVDSLRLGGGGEALGSYRPWSPGDEPSSLPSTPSALPQALVGAPARALLEPLPDPPRPRSADSQAGAGAPQPPARGLASMGSSGRALPPAGGPAAAVHVSARPGAIPSMLSMNRGHAPQTGLSGLVSIGSTPSAAAAAALAGPPMGLSGTAWGEGGAGAGGGPGSAAALEGGAGGLQGGVRHGHSLISTIGGVTKGSLRGASSGRR